MLYCKGNEVPQSYHYASAMATLSALAARRVWFDQGTFRVYPNLYVVLVGKPSDKKSTAMNIARKLATLCGIPAAPSAVTRERIYELMDDKNTSSACNQTFTYEDKTIKMSRLALYCNELVTLLSAGGEPLGMIEFLTDIWDKDSHEVETKNKGKNMIIGPCMTMLACMTPDQTQGLTKQQIITGGFSRRCLFIQPDDSPPPVPFPIVTPEQERAWLKLIEIGQEFEKSIGPFTLSPEAEVHYAQWYHKNYEDRKKAVSGPVGFFLNTLPRYVLQASMLYALSADRTSRVMQIDHIKKAVEWLEPLSEQLDDLFVGSGRNPLAALQARIKSMLKNSPVPLKRKVLQANLFDHASAAELSDVILHMVTTNQLRIEGSGRAELVYLAEKDYSSGIVEAEKEPDPD